MRENHPPLSQAVNEALAEEMRRDPTVFILGEDVAEGRHALQGAGRSL